MFLVQLDEAGNFVWGNGFGPSDTAMPLSIATNADHQIAVAGSFAGTLDINGEMISIDPLFQDIFAALFAPDGSPLWSQRFGDGSGNRQAASVAFAGSGLLLAGQLEGDADFGDGMPVMSPGDVDIFVAQVCGLSIRDL